LRINRYLSGCNVASRRKCEEIILAGRVKVNDEIIKDLAYQIDEVKDRVLVDNKPIKLEEEPVYYMLNKPVDVISAVSTTHGEVTVVDLIKDEKKRIFPVGRLDKDTSGLIFLTNDGDFSYCLTHPKFQKSKVYEALLRGKVDSRDIIKLSKGVIIDGRMTSGAKIELLKMINGNSFLQITISEGRNRQIRRMCEIIGHPVIALKRIGEGGIMLGELKAGEYRTLSKTEVQKLKRIEPAVTSPKLPQKKIVKKKSDNR